MDMQNGITASKMISKAVRVCIYLVALYIAFTFPVNLVLDLFWNRVSQEKVEKTPHNYGQMVGLPAGKGITKLSDIDQFLEKYQCVLETASDLKFFC